MLFNIRVRTLLLNKNNVAVIQEINKRGQPCTASEYSAAINGRENSPKHSRVVTLADEILTAWESKK